MNQNPDMAITDPKEAKRQAEKNRLEMAQIRKDIKAVLDTPEGMRFFAFLLQHGHTFTNGMTGNAYTYFNEGARNLVNKVLLFVPDEKLAELFKASRKDLRI